MELFTYEVFVSKQGDIPPVLYKPMEEAEPVTIDQDYIIKRISTQDDRFEASMHIADRIRGAFPPDMQVLMFDFLKEFGVPPEINLEYDSLPMSVLNIARTPSLRQVIESYAATGMQPVDAMRACERLERIIVPSPEEIALYEYFFWNIREMEMVGSNYIASYILNLRNQYKYDREIPTPYLRGKNVYKKDLPDRTTPWREMSVGNRESAPLDSYLLPAKSMIGIVEPDELTHKLGVANLPDEDVEARLQKSYSYFISELDYYARRKNNFLEAEKYLVLSKETARMMTWFNYKPTNKQKDLSDEMVIKEKSPDDYNLTSGSGNLPSVINTPEDKFDDYEDVTDLEAKKPGKNS